MEKSGDWKKGRLPWSIKEDWNYFMETTAGGSMIMGKICYQEFEPHWESERSDRTYKKQFFQIPSCKNCSLFEPSYFHGNQNQFGYAEEKHCTKNHFPWRIVFILLLSTRLLMGMFFSLPGKLLSLESFPEKNENRKNLTLNFYFLKKP